MKSCALAVCLALAAGPAAAIEGRYRVEGNNPGVSEAYRGEALVRRTGDTYALIWQIGPGRQVGTGILADGVLSVVFLTVGTSSQGVAQFRVENDRLVGGPWSLLGARASGSGRWAPLPAD